MKLNFSTVKRFLQFLSLSTNIICYIISILYTNTRSPKFIEYTHLNKTIINIYVLFFLSFFLLHTIYPKIICKVFKKNVLFLTNDKCKMIISFLISLMHWTANNTPQLLYGIIVFVTSFALYLLEYLFDCSTLNYATAAKTEKPPLSLKKNRNMEKGERVEKEILEGGLKIMVGEEMEMEDSSGKKKKTSRSGSLDLSKDSPNGDEKDNFSGNNYTSMSKILAK